MWTVRNLAVIAAGAFIVILLLIKGCTSQREAAEQAKHESRTATAYTEAAKEAVETVAARSNGEAELKEVVAVAAKEIANAEGSNQPITPDVRDAALYGACSLPNYRDEPACRVHRADP